MLITIPREFVFSVDMKTIVANQSIKPYTTFGIDAITAEFSSVTTLEELKEQLSSLPKSGVRILGGGSNMLWTQDFSGRTLHVNFKGIKIISEDDHSVIVEAQAGENWHELVLWTLQHNYGGVENLALIPGNIGAAPIQNIGAYGVELKDVFVQCRVIHIDNLKEEVLDAAACQFGYRDSIFKGQLKNKVVITAVQLRLRKVPHTLNTAYGALEKELEGKSQTIQEVAQAVIRIRQSKLPDPKKIGNCGSFFKNPVIGYDTFEGLQARFPEIPSYPAPTGRKLPAAWLIDRLGFKGLRRGDAGVHPHQALVLVNYGEAKGSEIWSLAQEIQKAVFEKFGVTLEAEVTRY